MHGVHQAAPNRWLVRSEQTKFGQDVLDLVQGLRSSDLLHGEGTSTIDLQLYQAGTTRIADHIVSAAASALHLLQLYL